MAEWTQETKEEKIKKEIRRLNKIFKDLSKKEKDVIDGLIKRAAHMRVSLEEMEEDINENGYVEEFTQGIGPMAPRYDRERPVARLYNSLNKNYQTIMKQLFEFVPRKPATTDGGEAIKKAEEEFDEFLKSRKG